MFVDIDSINAIDVVSSLSESADPLDALIDHEYQSNFKPEVDEIEDLKDVVEVKKDVSNIAIQDTTVSLEAIQAKLSANEISIPLNLSESAIISATVPKVPNLFEISNSARFEGVLPSTQGHPSPSGTTSYNAYDAQTMSYGQGQQQYYSNSQPNTARSDIIQQPPLTSRVNIAPTTYPEDLSSLSIHEFYGKFWEISFKLFSNVCSPYISCHDCLTVVEGK